MIRRRNIVCIASSWFDHPTSKHHVMRRLAAENDVIWINFHASRRPQLNAQDARVAWRRLARIWAGPTRVAPRLQVLSPPLLPWPEAAAARAVNTRLLSRYIRSALRRLPRRPAQLWLFTPDVPELARVLKWERVVYYCVDDFAAFSGFNTGLIERLERQTLTAADVVITTSAALHEPRAARHACVHQVPHGVDVEHFGRATKLPLASVPDDLRRIPHPVFGFMGVVSDYLDFDLLATAARRKPDWSFVLLGDVRCETDAVANVPNVHLLGGRPYDALPAYCRGFDVGLIPFRMNRLVRAVNPIKLREYLAAGLPVVSAPLGEVRRYAPAVRVAAELPEFLAACEAALRDARTGDAAARQALVQDESWTVRLETLSRIVMEMPASAAPDSLSLGALRLQVPAHV